MMWFELNQSRAGFFDRIKQKGKHMDYYQGFVSATSDEEAHKILGELLEKRLVAGGQILEGESNHHWKGEIEKLPYWTVIIFTKPECSDEIIEIVERISNDEIPGVTFVKIEKGNVKFLDWIKESAK